MWTLFICTYEQYKYLKDKFILGDTYYFYGKVSVKLGRIDMTSPVYDAEDSNKNTGKIIPLYPLTYGISQNNIRAIIENGLKDAGILDETLPDSILKLKNLIGLNEAVNQIHFPEDFSKFDKYYFLH